MSATGKRRLIIVLLFLLLVGTGAYLLLHDDSSPTPEEQIKRAYMRSKDAPYAGPESKGFDNVMIGDHGQGLPEGTWWVGSPPKGYKIVLLGAMPHAGPQAGTDYTKLQRRVAYLPPRQAKLARQGYFPMRIPFMVQTEKLGSPEYEKVFAGGIPLRSKTHKVKGLGTLIVDPTKAKAILFPRGKTVKGYPSELVIVTAEGPINIDKLKKVLHHYRG